MSLIIDYQRINWGHHLNVVAWKNLQGAGSKLKILSDAELHFEENACDLAWNEKAEVLFDRREVECKLGSVMNWIVRSSSRHSQWWRLIKCWLVLCKQRPPHTTLPTNFPLHWISHQNTISLFFLMEQESCSIKLFVTPTMPGHCTSGIRLPPPCPSFNLGHRNIYFFFFLLYFFGHCFSELCKEKCESQKFRHLA